MSSSTCVLFLCVLIIITNHAPVIHWTTVLFTPPPPPSKPQRFWVWVWAPCIKFKPPQIDPSVFNATFFHVSIFRRYEFERKPWWGDPCVIFSYASVETLCYVFPMMALLSLCYMNKGQVITVCLCYWSSLVSHPELPIHKMISPVLR